MSKSWYVINSYSGYENKAKEQLMERITKGTRRVSLAVLKFQRKLLQK